MLRYCSSSRIEYISLSNGCIASWANDDDDNVWANDTTNRTGYAGGGLAHENLPPYRTLWYIVRVE